MNVAQRNKNNTQIIFLKLNLLINNENKLGLVKKRLLLLSFHVAAC